MMDTKTVIDQRPAWWLLRFMSGDAFAISNLPEELHWTEMDDICQTQMWCKPEALRQFINAGESIILDYHVEEITETYFETLTAFGLPLVDTFDERGMLVLKS